MKIIPKSKVSIDIIGWLVLILGFTMIVYWVLYIVGEMPIGDIPILSEFVTALLALVTGLGLIKRKTYAVPMVLILSGMWAYGVIGGIGLVIQHGLSFESPFGALTDALIFPVILLFTIWMAGTVWINRAKFNSVT